MQNKKIRTICKNMEYWIENPMTYIKGFYHSYDISHIEYIPKLKNFDYCIVRGASHDGTLYFTHELLRDVLWRLVNHTTYFKPEPPIDWSMVKGMKYTIGDIKHSRIFKKVTLGIKDKFTYDGLRERIRIPVKAEFVYYKDGEKRTRIYQDPIPKKKLKKPKGVHVIK